MFLFIFFTPVALSLNLFTCCIPPPCDCITCVTYLLLINWRLMGGCLMSELENGWLSLYCSNLKFLLNYFLQHVVVSGELIGFLPSIVVLWLAGWLHMPCLTLYVCTCPFSLCLNVRFPALCLWHGCMTMGRGFSLFSKVTFPGLWLKGKLSILCTGQSSGWRGIFFPPSSTGFSFLLYITVICELLFFNPTHERNTFWDVIMNISGQFWFLSWKVLCRNIVILNLSNAENKWLKMNTCSDKCNYTGETWGRIVYKCSIWKFNQGVAARSQNWHAIKCVFKSV